jgi:hypothetical protein
MAELRAVSSRGEISATSYVNEYHWGDFKGNPDAWMRDYFDGFLYFANWGTKTLKLRLPKALLGADTVSSYCSGESFWVSSTDDHTILTYNLSPEGAPDDWLDDEGFLGSLIGLRTELASGDLRCLYLGWLIDHGYEYCDDDEDEDLDGAEFEPPVPAGLKELTASQQCLVDFFDIDADLLAAAASASPPMVHASSTTDDLSRWIAQIPEAEKDAYLLRVLRSAGPAVGLEMVARFQKEMAPAGLALDSPEPRSHRQLHALKNTLRDARIKAERAREAEAKKRRLDDLAKRLPDVWAQVERLIESKKANEYDQATRLLREIKELAERGGVPDFAARIGAIRARHSTKRALLDRLQSLR